jgi:hypothetical protein
LIVGTAAVLFAGWPGMATLAAPIDKVAPVIELQAQPFPLEDVR